MRSLRSKTEGVTEHRRQLGNPSATRPAELAYPDTSSGRTRLGSHTLGKYSVVHPPDRTYRRRRRRSLGI